MFGVHGEEDMDAERRAGLGRETAWVGLGWVGLGWGCGTRRGVVLEMGMGWSIWVVMHVRWVFGGEERGKRVSIASGRLELCSFELRVTW